MSKFIDLTGKRFGRLVVQRFVGIVDHDARWECLCDCGTISVNRRSSLRRGDTTSCGCLRKDYCKELGFISLPEGQAALNRIYSTYKWKASHSKTKILCFELTLEEFAKLTQEPCHYCGVAPYQVLDDKRYNGAFFYNGLDRKDSNIGYTVDNVVPCCGRCNIAKSDMTEDEFIKWLGRIFTHIFFNKTNTDVHT